MEISGHVLFDTNVYLRVLRSEAYARSHLERFTRLAPRTYLCSVVVAELYAGARTLSGVRLIDGLLAPYLRVRSLSMTMRQSVSEFSVDPPC